MAGVGFPGVSPGAERGTTQTGVKAPKCRLSAKPKGVPRLRQRGGGPNSSHPLKAGYLTLPRVGFN
ncbi:hypothetical protein ACAM_1206 [Aeropyrum camini SY1 = JCM 12091]|uniref:Uncharacterized protein n=1 Tax=Aeropyrum camini SY1 = JCM 12091 TaxID=1198449 RepID=U3TF74_9CREN|nr:hypothetical protein ACAM_1206 [Aeropyrum camini SY1 = JCM 12091]